MQVGEPEEMGGASAEEIQKIPVLRFTFHSDETTSIAESHISIKSTGANRPPETAARVGFFRRMLLRKARQQANPVDIENPKSKREYPTISFDCTEDSVCAICLSNYEQDELICRLWYVCTQGIQKTKWNRRVSYPFIIFSLGASIIFTKTVFMNGLLSTVCARCASKILGARSMRL
jgi:hypothetical protein